MLKEKHVKQKPHNYEVLILILMEHAQRENTVRGVLRAPRTVLILILMEHAQRAPRT